MTLTRNTASNFISRGNHYFTKSCRVELYPNQILRWYQSFLWDLLHHLLSDLCYQVIHHLYRRTKPNSVGRERVCFISKGSHYLTSLFYRVKLSQLPNLRWYPRISTCYQRFPLSDYQSFIFNIHRHVGILVLSWWNCQVFFWRFKHSVGTWLQESGTSCWFESIDKFD
jgi:hypothetical protein